METETLDKCSSRIFELFSDPEKVSLVPLEEVPVLRSELARLNVLLDTLLFTRLLSGDGNGRARRADRSLSIKEAANKLGWSRDYLYRNYYKFPFTLKGQGRRKGCSDLGIDEWIQRQCQGR